MTEISDYEKPTNNHQKRKRDYGKSTDNNAELTTDVAQKGRKEAKRRKKQEKLLSEGNQRVGEGVPDSAVSKEFDKVAVKARRKAEKALLKAAKKIREDGGKSQTPRVIPLENGIDGTIAKKKKKRESSSLRAGYHESPSLTALPQPEIDSFLSKNFISINDPSTSEALRPITKFSQLPENAIPPDSPFAAFQNPTPIQSAAWPFLLSGRDVVGVAETGSGKTLAFGIPCIRSITASNPTLKSVAPARAVIVSPTRELAVQIHEQIEQLATPASLSTACVYGGVPKDEQRTALKTAHIIVATPGRLNDLIEEGAADLSSIAYLVLDEADRMLDKGFEDAIRQIISTTPPTGRQTLMFTATWPPSVRALASTFMQSPVHISIGRDNPDGALRANTSIHQIIEVMDPWAKNQRLLDLLKKHQSGPSNSKPRILIFCLYKKEASRIESFLLSHRYTVSAIHGDLSQNQRTASLTSFKTGQCPLLIATDVAARGLDIPAVKLVINVTFPLTVEDYVHRIGRTGRAGAEGLAITFFTDHEKGLAGGLVNVLKAAGQEVPEELLKFGGTVKKKGHEAYGAFYKDVGEGKREGTKIKFED